MKGHKSYSNKMALSVYGTASKKKIGIAEFKSYAGKFYLNGAVDILVDILNEHHENPFTTVDEFNGHVKELYVDLVNQFHSAFGYKSSNRMDLGKIIENESKKETT